MTEYYTVKRIDNSRLVRPMRSAELQDFGRRLVAGAGLAACLMAYACQHFECIRLRYGIEQLESERAQAAQFNQQLRLEIATLRSPMRVDAIARQELGLTVPAPSQVAPVEGPSEATLAQARPVAQASRP